MERSCPKRMQKSINWPWQFSAVGKLQWASDTGQPEAVTQHEPHPVLDELIGKANECIAYLNGHHCLALLDTGSQVTSISEHFYKEHLSEQQLRPLDGLIHVVGASGQEVPFLGYVELDIGFPCVEPRTDRVFSTLVLVVPDSSISAYLLF